MLQSYVKIIASDEIATVLKWMCLAVSMALAIFAIGVALGYWLRPKKHREIPEMRDAQVQTENEGIDDVGSLALAIPAAARSDDPVIYFTLYGDCYHKGRDCPGLNPRRYELRTRRQCRICERRG